MSEEAARAHLNLVEASRRLFQLDSGAVVEVGPGWLLGAGSAEHPTISNAAYREDDALAPRELIGRAREFFAARGRGFALWARGGVEADAELIEAAEGAGLACVYEMPEMLLRGRPPSLSLPAGVRVERVESEADRGDFWRVVGEAFADIGFPTETMSNYDRLDGLLADGVAALLARLDGEPVATSMAITSHGVAGVYWVATAAAARGRGLGAAMTARAVEAGLAMGADVASLQASPMGAPVYRSMGFEDVHGYRLHLSPPPD